MCQEGSCCLKCCCNGGVAQALHVDSQERSIERLTPLLEREQNLLSAAYKASLAPRRSALKAISKMICKEENEGNLDKISCAREYFMRLKAEAEGICCELLEMVQQLVLQTEGSEHIVFYQKMQGDYYRHLAEIREGTAKTKAVRLARWKYDQAEILAERDLEITNPIRLAVALNYSILIAEWDDDHWAARRKARWTYDAALQQLDDIPEAGTDGDMGQMKGWIHVKSYVKKNNNSLNM